MKNQHLKQLLELSLATVFISTSGVLGKFIAMPPPVTVWWRAALAMLILLGYCKYKKISLKLQSRKDTFSFILSALFLAAHWITYFYALKLSNVALGILSLYTFPIITALLEPLFIKTKPYSYSVGITRAIGHLYFSSRIKLPKHLCKRDSFRYTLRVVIRIKNLNFKTACS